MMIKVGTIDGEDVIYIPEKDLIFCKNTTVKYSLMCDILKGNMDKYEIPNKKLIIIKDNNIITLGCLTTTISNCNTIKHNIISFKNESRKKFRVGTKD